MSNHSAQPKSDDAVLGSQNPAPLTGAVLGGLAGIKQRLSNHSAESKMAIFEDALKYGSKGLDFVIQALKYAEEKIAIAAWNALQNQTDPQIQQALDENIPLFSEVEADYAPLQNLLAAQQWQEADEETRTILLKISHRENRWLRREDIAELPCTDLRTIDRLWVYYSQGRFGFSVQSRLWKKCASETLGKKNAELHESFCDSQGDRFASRVGWRSHITVIDNWGRTKDLIERCEKIPFDLNAPVGHLPTVCALGGGDSKEKFSSGDTESTMGFYASDSYWTEWSWDSFFGPEMLECFFDRCIQAGEL